MTRGQARDEWKQKSQWTRKTEIITRRCKMEIEIKEREKALKTSGNRVILLACIGYPWMSCWLLYRDCGMRSCNSVDNFTRYFYGSQAKDFLIFTVRCTKFSFL